MSRLGSRSTGVSTDEKADLLERLTSAEVVVSEPDRLDPADYDLALEEFVGAVIDHPSVVSVYGDSVTPVVPGLSDLDVVIVVEDEPREIDDLGDRVAAVLERHDRVVDHGPVLVPESAFEYLSLFANTVTYLDHVAGEPLSTLEADETVHLLRYFDRLGHEPYTHIPKRILPQSTLTSHRTADVPLLSNAARFVGPIVAAEFGIRPASPGVLHLDTRQALSKATNVRHQWNQYVSVFGDPPPGDEAVLDRVESYRREYFERDLSVEEFLGLLLDAIALSHTISSSLLERQSIYPTLDHPVTLRGVIPAVALPNWRSISSYRVLELFLDSRVVGAIVPSEAAVHLLIQPWGEKLFYGTPPASDIEDPRLCPVIERRNEGLRQLLTFSATNDIDRDVFLTNTMIDRLHGAGILDTESVQQRIHRRLARVRNGVLTRSWIGAVDRAHSDGPAP